MPLSALPPDPRSRPRARRRGKLGLLGLRARDYVAELGAPLPRRRTAFCLRAAPRAPAPGWSLPGRRASLGRQRHRAWSTTRRRVPALADQHRPARRAPAGGAELELGPLHVGAASSRVRRAAACSRSSCSRRAFQCREASLRAREARLDRVELQQRLLGAGGKPVVLHRELLDFAPQGGWVVGARRRGGKEGGEGGRAKCRETHPGSSGTHFHERSSVSVTSRLRLVQTPCYHARLVSRRAWRLYAIRPLGGPIIRLNLRHSFVLVLLALLVLPLAGPATPAPPQIEAKEAEARSVLAQIPRAGFDARAT